MNGTGIFSWSVLRDKNGRITQKTESYAGGTAAVYEYDYDAAGRLLSVTKDGTAVETYQYDSRPYGTRTYQEINGVGKLLSYSDEDHLLRAGEVTYQHDADGFLVSRTQGTQVTTYDYSLRGELLKVTLPGKTVEYIHDPLGRRIAKKIDNVIVEKYLWQGMTRLLAVYDGNDALLMRFEYADAMPFAMTMGGAIYYLAYDQVGSLRVVADGSGNPVKRIDYDSFGNVFSDSAPNFAVPFGFAGGLYDRDTGLVRFGYRDYDPDTGRWTAKDPIGFNGGDTDLYGYCVNDPVNLVDQSGKIPALVMAVGAVVGGVTNYMAMRDSLSGWDLAKSVAFGAGLGAVGAFVPGILPNTIAGGLFAAINDLNNQALSKPCISWSDTRTSIKNGLWGGFLFGVGAKVGGNMGVLHK